MSKKTVITIVFDDEIKQRRLQKLLSDIDAQCSEDHNGRSWCKGSYDIETEIVESQHEEDKSEN